MSSPSPPPIPEARANGQAARCRKELVDQFQRLQETAAEAAQDPGGHAVTLPREVIQYVEDGRNPDIYTREFVELVIKQNQMMKGKRRAFAAFRDVLATRIVVAFPELQEDVTRVVDATSDPPASSAPASAAAATTRS